MQHSDRPSLRPLTAAEIETISKALSIGFISWDGDGWYASKDHLGPSGTDYEEAEAIFREAQRILAEVVDDAT